LFLSNRGAMCRYGLRQLKAESNASLYVTSMCRLFFTSLIDTAIEFLKAFPQHLGCFSSQSNPTLLSVCYFPCLSVCLFLCLYSCQSFCLSISVLVCLSVCLFSNKAFVHSICWNKVTCFHYTKR